MRGARIPYSNAELEFIRSRCALSRREIWTAFAREFNRVDVTESHINSLCKRMKWASGRSSMERAWSDDDTATLRALYADTPTGTIAKQLGRPLAATYGRAKKLGLKKSDAFLASPAGGRLQSGDPRAGIRTRFQKGHESPTKGVRRPGWSSGRMRETQFKKGTATNWKPIGSERIAEGYCFTKISDHRGVSWTVNWRQTHILRWEEKHGPIPKGYVLKSLDGDRLNVEPTNWDLVPRGVIARLAGKSGRDYNGAPAELKPIILKIAKLEHAAAK